MFHLHPTSGILSIAQQLDREMVEKIQMGLMVEDTASQTGPQISSTTITINIEDINDNSPKFREPYYKFSITENSKNGVTIGNVLADDPDLNKTITYTLDGRYEITELIYLDSNSGDLVVANKIDHEVYDWLNLTV